MDRRGFIKNSIGALLFGALTSNKVLAEVVDTMTPKSPKVLLYLIQTINGEWKIRATKWVDLPIKRLIPSEVNPKTFKPLDIVDLNNVYERRNQLWQEYNCTGRMGHLISLGIPMTDEMKKEYVDYAKKHIGIKRKKETKQKIANKAIGRKSAMKGKTFSHEAKIKMSESAKLKVLTEEHKNNIGKSVSGEKNGFYGKTHSDESLKKIMDKHPSKIKKVCPHCKKEFDCANYSRYHGDNCKHKK
jgi:hypothetical protein